MNNNFILSVIIPCLNEKETIGMAVKSCLDVFNNMGIRGEVVVIDNGSDDGSGDIAFIHGARVVLEENKGYGSALIRGIKEAEGYYIFMADADMSYDFYEIGNFLEKMRLDNLDLLVGCRFSYGGGCLASGAMPLFNRIGNFILSGIARVLFRIKIHDFHCGARMFVKDKIININLRSPGMEFASEMIISAYKKGLKIGEIGINFKKDAREKDVSKLRPFRDGLRHIIFMFKSLR